MLVQHVRVVTLERYPGAPADARPSVVPPVPAKLPEGVWIVLARISVALVVVTRLREADIAGQHPYLVALGAHVAHSRAPNELVAPEVMGRVHVANGQNAHNPLSSMARR
jgi:hypothetical protein